MKRFCGRALTGLILLIAPAGVDAAEPAIIATARAFLGSEATLEGVTAVRYSGTMTSPDPKNPGTRVRATVELAFQKPDRQVMTVTSDAAIETTVLDGYDAWQEQRDPKDPSKRRVMLLGPDQIRRLRASAWENLSYFRGLESRGGQVVDGGVVTVDGVVCRKISFIHGKGIEFHRYFDAATARLVRSETENGAVVREQGELLVGGIRFPRTIITTPGGQAKAGQEVTVTFEKIVINEPLPEARFAVPVLRLQPASAQRPAGK